MRIAFRPEARAEVIEAKAWYERQASGLGLEFARAVEASISSAVRMPEAYPVIEVECRRALLRRFPHAVIFRLSSEELLVVAVFHHTARGAGLVMPGQSVTAAPA